MKENTRKRSQEEGTYVLTSSRMASFPILTSSLLVSTSKEGTKCFSIHASRMLIRNLRDKKGWMEWWRLVKEYNMSESTSVLTLFTRVMTLLYSTLLLVEYSRVQCSTCGTYASQVDLASG